MGVPVLFNLLSWGGALMRVLLLLNLLQVDVSGVDISKFDDAYFKSAEKKQKKQSEVRGGAEQGKGSIRRLQHAAAGARGNSRGAAARRRAIWGVRLLARPAPLRLREAFSFTTRSRSVVSCNSCLLMAVRFSLSRCAIPPIKPPCRRASLPRRPRRRRCPLSMWPTRRRWTRRCWAS